MSEGARLFFVDIEEHNRQAEILAQTYSSLDALIDDLVGTRKQLLELLEEKYDDKTKFSIDGENYTYKRFVHIFIHHDEHHKKQIESFLQRHAS